MVSIVLPLWDRFLTVISSFVSLVLGVDRAAVVVRIWVKIAFSVTMLATDVLSDSLAWDRVVRSSAVYSRYSSWITVAP